MKKMVNMWLLILFTIQINRSSFFDSASDEVADCFKNDEQVSQQYRNELLRYFYGKAIVVNRIDIAQAFESKIYETKDFNSMSSLTDISSKNSHLLLQAMQTVGMEFPHLQDWMMSVCDE